MERRTVRALATATLLLTLGTVAPVTTAFAGAGSGGGVNPPPGFPPSNITPLPGQCYAAAVQDRPGGSLTGQYLVARYGKSGKVVAITLRSSQPKCELSTDPVVLE